MLELDDLSLRDIIRWLTTPARCGFYFSMEDLARIGRAIGASVSPFSRFAATEQLVRSAALDDRVPELFAAIRVEMESQIESYRACDHPALMPWIERASRGLETWTEIERTVAESGENH